MRRAYTDKGWLESEGTVFGFSLGYDFCAEHEFGATFIKRAFGIADSAFPLGVEDRTATRVPESLVLRTYTHKPKDRRYKAQVAAAVLVCCDPWRRAAGMTVAELVSEFQVSFYTEITDKRYKPADHDIEVAWSGRSGFAIHVRGDENVAKLTELHAAMLECAISVADASITGFKRKALALVLNERLPQETLDAVRAQDQAHLRLHQAAEATGIAALLSAAGRGWYALSPAWRTCEGSELLFFLNPHEQSRYGSGWFTVGELKEWAEGRGPVVDQHSAEAALKAVDVDWHIHLSRGLRDAGTTLRVFPKPVWLDEAKTELGIRLLVSEDATLKDGTYPWAEMLPYVRVGQAPAEASA